MAGDAAASCGRWPDPLTRGPAPTAMALPDGLYDQLLTERMRRSLAGIGNGHADLAARQGVAGAALAEAVTRQLAAILDGLPGDGADKAQHPLTLVNGLLVLLRQRLQADAGAAALGAPADMVDLVVSPLQVLRAVQRDGQFAQPPQIGLAAPWLFTAGKGSPSLPPPTPVPPRRVRWTNWPACPAARCGCRWTGGARGCMPRPGCSSARPASDRPTWAAPTCQARP